MYGIGAGTLSSSIHRIPIPEMCIWLPVRTCLLQSGYMYPCKHTARHQPSRGHPANAARNAFREQGRLLRQGLRPVVRTGVGGEWKRLPMKVDWEGFSFPDGREGLTVARQREWTMAPGDASLNQCGRSSADDSRPSPDGPVQSFRNPWPIILHKCTSVVECATRRTHRLQICWFAQHDPKMNENV